MNPALGSFFTALGFFVGIAVYWWRAKEMRLDTSGTLSIMLVGAVFGVLVARVVERVVEGGSFVTVLNPLYGGRTILGGVIGGLVAVEIAKRRMGVRYSTGPRWALAIPAGEFFGRIGCYFNGCCGGRACAPGLFGGGHYPTQAMMAGSALVLFGVLFWKRSQWPVWPLFLMGWGLSRFVIEFFRESASGPGVSVAQWACLGVMGYGVVKCREVKA